MKTILEVAARLSFMMATLGGLALMFLFFVRRK